MALRFLEVITTTAPAAMTATRPYTTTPVSAVLGLSGLVGVVGVVGSSAGRVMVMRPWGWAYCSPTTPLSSVVM